MWISRKIWMVVVTDKKWWLLRIVGSTVQEIQSYAATSAGISQLCHLLAQQPAPRLRFLTDLVDEHYHLERLPAVKGVTLRRLLQRRLAAWPLAQALHTAHRLGRGNAARAEDAYLFSAVHAPLLLECLQSLASLRLIIQGVHTVSLCLPCWLPLITAPHPHCLCVQADCSQLRFSYLQQHRLLFSQSMAWSADACTPERLRDAVAQFRFTMLGQQWLAEGERLHILWLVEAWQADTCTGLAMPFVATQAVLPLSTLPQHLGWRSPPVGADMRWWPAVQVVLDGARLPDLAPTDCIEAKRRRQMTHLLSGWATLALLFMLLTGWLSHVGQQTLQVRAQQVAQSVRAGQASLPAQPLELAQMAQIQALVQRVHQLEAAKRLPHRALAGLQKGMAGLLTWQLQSVEWQYGPAAAGQVAGTMPVWEETLSVTCARTPLLADDQAMRDWQTLLVRLRTDTDIALVARAPGRAGESQWQGSTQPVLAPGDTQGFSIRLRSPKATNRPERGV